MNKSIIFIFLSLYSCNIYRTDQILIHNQAFHFENSSYEKAFPNLAMGIMNYKIKIKKLRKTKMWFTNTKKITLIGTVESLQSGNESFYIYSTTGVKRGDTLILNKKNEMLAKDNFKFSYIVNYGEEIYFYSPGFHLKKIILPIFKDK